ncbi:hypothetical protein L4D09_05315 [Photobacterium makurazakiensis]|uniref:hypothetical protein n=1 Tax=Photobacterium makurazakiensis TaxID=2910234 RepID=UPI003D12B060
MMKSRMLVLLAAMLVILTACSESEPQPEEKPAVDSPSVKVPADTPEVDPQPVQLPADVDIWQSPEVLELSGVKLHLGSELWLNTMPVIGDDGTSPANKLYASIKLLTQEMKTLPEGIEVVQVMVAQEEQQWLAKDELDIRAEGDMSLEAALHGGPEWLPGSKADIAVTVSFDGHEHTLIEKGVLINQVF